MKHIFIINPAAGAVDAVEKIKKKIEKEASGYDYSIYETKAPLDATEYIRFYCSTHTEKVRFYACGGDGTLNEVVNGAAGFPNAEVGCIPSGSGNDFVKYYGAKEEFLDIVNNLEGTAETIDMLKLGDKYSINVINFGFDGVVASTISKVKRKPIIGGKNSYTSGIVYAIFKGMRNKCTVKVDGEQLNEKNMLLCTLSNGSHVGGSFNCGPKSSNMDGEVDVCLFKPLSLFTFLSLMDSYKKGTHFENPKFAKYMAFKRGKTVEVEAKKKEFPVSVDGEMVYTNKFTVEMVPKSINFVVPKSLVGKKNPVPAKV